MTLVQFMYAINAAHLRRTNRLSPCRRECYRILALRRKAIAGTNVIQLLQLKERQEADPKNWQYVLKNSRLVAYHSQPCFYCF